MKTVEIAYCLAVATCLVLITALSLQRYSQLTGGMSIDSATISIGKARAVNVEQFRQLLQQGKLAEKEAVFYTTSPAPDASGK